MRLSSLNNLKRKYNRNIMELIELKESRHEDIQQLENKTQSFEKLEQEKSAALAEMEKLASFLQNYRLERKHFLETRIKKELQDLDMPDAGFEIEVKEGTFDQRGYSDVRFLFSPNKGEPL